MRGLGRALVRGALAWCLLGVVAVLLVTLDLWWPWG
jgi:hypothetical protein